MKGDAASAEAVRCGRCRAEFERIPGPPVGWVYPAYIPGCRHAWATVEGLIGGEWVPVR